MEEITNKKIITRFAPSPTGFLHVGGARSALFNYVYAKQHGGKVILRIEDTDKERSKPEHTEGIKKAFAWLGLKFDEYYLQSENIETHKKYLKKLIADGKAYISKETVLEEGQRDEVIRFKNPNIKIKFQDLIKNEVEFDTTELGDFILAKSLAEPIFHLANVIDDITEGVTHIIRGEEHLSNTPRQILIWEAINEKPRPIYGHIPLILSETREKLSKRKHGESVSIEYYEKEGYLPEAMINFIATLGWNPGNDVEIFSLNEMIDKFDINKVQKSGAIFNKVKLLWFNKEYIKKLPIDRLKKEIGDRLKVKYTYTDELLDKVINIITERINTFGELEKYVAEGEFDYFFQAPTPVKEMIIWKKDNDFQITKKNLEVISEMIEKILEADFTEIKLKEILMPKAEELGKGSVLWPLRVSLSGKDKSPDPFTLLGILSKEESLKRIRSAIMIL
jgi:glutamyl-tRNA synthetase